MKMRVKLYGTLRGRFSKYEPSRGMEVEIPNGAEVRELLDLLGIPESAKAVVAAEGRILKGSDKIEDGSVLNVFQTIHGG